MMKANLGLFYRLEWSEINKKITSQKQRVTDMNLFKHYMQMPVFLSVLASSSHSPMVFICCARGDITCLDATAGGRWKSLRWTLCTNHWQCLPDLTPDDSLQTQRGLCLVIDVAVMSQNVVLAGNDDGHGRSDCERESTMWAWVRRRETASWVKGWQTEGQQGTKPNSFS